jgi:Trypsin-like peptidase domain
MTLYEPLYTQAARACCCITVFLKDELISEGTGFAISQDGAVFTAAHVVTGRMPIQERDYRDPQLRIFAKFPSLPLLELRVAVCGIHITVDAFNEKVQIDQALLLPSSPVQFPFPPFTIGSPPSLGEEVFFAGYSDELEIPFRVDRIVKPEVAGASEFLEAMKRGYRADMTGPMIKRGVVGNVRRISTCEVRTNAEIECEVFYVDNSIHSGASGGPFLNRQGQAVGVIFQRATTSAAQSSDPRLLVPSGATVGLGLQTIPAMYRKLNGV